MTPDLKPRPLQRLTSPDGDSATFATPCTCAYSGRGVLVRPDAACPVHSAPVTRRHAELVEALFITGAFVLVCITIFLLGTRAMHLLRAWGWM